MARYEDQKKARRLRMQGHTLLEIGNFVGAGKGLVSLWVRDVQISERGKIRLEKVKQARIAHLRNDPSVELYPHLAEGRRTLSLRRFEEREAYREQGRVLARKGEDLLHAVACALYWAEGAKSQNSLVFTNSDLSMVKTFVAFCIKYFKVSPEDFCMKITAYTNVHTKEKILEYWESALGLKGAKHRQHSFDVTKYSSKGQNPKTVGKLPYGVCSLSFHKSTWMVQHIYGALEIYGGAMIYPVSRSYKKS